MSSTRIEWTDATWNPVTGCTKMSAGCQHCYAETMSRRLKAMGVAKYSKGFAVSLHEDALSEPEKWRKPRTIFVCSMSDLFHKDVPFDFIDKVLAVIERTPQHRYQILTKRAERMAEYFSTRVVPANVWLGVTVDVKASKPRIDSLRGIKNANGNRLDYRGRGKWQSGQTDEGGMGCEHSETGGDHRQNFLLQTVGNMGQ